MTLPDPKPRYCCDDRLLPCKKCGADVWRSAKKLPIGADFVLVRIGNPIEAHVKPADQAAVLVSKAGAALRSPGISRGSVFRGPAPQKVFAYSVAPGDAGMLVREAQDGTKQLGKIGADGRFRVSRKIRTRKEPYRRNAKDSPL